MAVPDSQPAGAAPKVKPKTAIIVVGVVAAGAYLFLRSRSAKTSPAGSPAPGAGTVTTSYGLGPQWVLTAVKDLHSPPKRKPSRGMTDNTTDRT